MGTKWLLIALPLIVFGVLAQSALWVPTYDSQAKVNPERLETFLRAEQSDAKVLNPILYTQVTAADVCENNVFEGLVAPDANSKLVGKLADHWQVTEDAYVAALPERTLPDGRPATAAHIASLIEAARKEGRLGGLEASISAVELVPAENRTHTETALVESAKGRRPRSTSNSASQFQSV